MSASEAPGDSSAQGTNTPSDIAGELRELSRRMQTLEARGAEHQADLERLLSDAMRALELIHDDDPGARRRLRELRDSPSYAAAFDTPDPLVSVVIPTWNRVQTLLERALPSALAQSHGNIEVIVVGDASPPEVGAAIERLGDSRVSFHNLTIRGPYEQGRYRSWLSSGTPGLNAGVALARGLWIAPLGDDDEFEPQHVERLLAEARTRRLEFVYGRGRVLLPDGRETQLGEFPPRLTQIGLQSAVYHAGLRFLELELGHALFDKPNDWGLVHRMMRVGVRIGMLDETTVVYRPSLRAQTPGAGQDAPREPPAATAASPSGPGQSAAPAPDASARIAELERELAGRGAEAQELARRLEEVRRSRSWRLTAPLRRMRAR
jgi:Glycosyl transferase family 2